MSITFPALKIADGIILFLVSLEMLFNKRRERKEEDANFDSDNISVFSSIIAIILAGLSVQYVLDGINEFLIW